MDTSVIETDANPFRRKCSPHPLLAAAAARPQGSFLSAALTEGASIRPHDNRGSSADLKTEKKAESDTASTERKKKKRKRAELEEDYEKRMHGVGAVDDEGEKPTKAAGRKRKSADAAAEMAEEARMTDDGFYDESKLLRTVFVANLPLRTKTKALMREFGDFGEIESVCIRSVPLLETEDKKPRRAAVMIRRVNEATDSVNAYIIFKEEESARAALSRNMALFEDHHIRVDMACPPRKKLKGEGTLYDRKRAVFIENLPFDVKDEEIYTLFCGACKSDEDVEAVRVLRDPVTCKGKGVAYVLFKTREVAYSMCRRRDLKIKDLGIRITHVKKPAEATTESTPKKRKEISAEVEAPHKKQTVSRSGDESNETNRFKAKAASLSYQGKHSSESSALKKKKLHPNPVKEGWRGRGDHCLKVRKIGDGIKKMTTMTTRGHEPKLKVGEGDAVDDLPKKRKLEAGTPESTHRSKKLKGH